jgi:hypothetical protein
MGTTEDWRKVIETVAAFIVEVAERRADNKGSAICSLCRDLSTSLFPVSRGHVCPTCIAVAHVELVKDWRKLKGENEQLRALFRQLESAGISLTQVVDVMNRVAADLKSQTAEIELLRQAARVAETDLLAARETNASLSEQLKAAQREAESLQNEIEAIRAEKAVTVAAGASAVLAEIKSATASENFRSHHGPRLDVGIVTHGQVDRGVLERADGGRPAAAGGAPGLVTAGHRHASKSRLFAPGPLQWPGAVVAGETHPAGHPDGRQPSRLLRAPGLVLQTPTGVPRPSSARPR